MKVFLRKEIIIVQLLILCLLFAISKSDDLLPKNDKIEFNGLLEKKFILKCDRDNNALKLEVKGVDPNTVYILSIYSDETRNNRIQLAQSLNGYAMLLFEFDELEIIYISLECYPNNKCSGILSNKFSPKMFISEGDIFNFYVSEEKTWTFYITSKSEMSNVWARGQLPIKTNLKIDNTYYKENEGNYYIVSSSMNNKVFEIKPQVGDFINIGCLGFTKDQKMGTENYESNSKLIINGPKISGYLKKGVIDQICYQMESKIEEPSEHEEDFENDNVIFGSGVIFTKIANSYMAYLNGEKVSDDKKDELFSLGIISNIISPSDVKEQKFCMSFPDKSFIQYNTIEEILFSFQLVQESSKYNGFNLYEPQINGVFYPRLIMKDSKVAFIPQYNYNSYDKINYNLMTINGFPKMHVIDCDNYPLCSFEEIDKKNDVRPRNINRFSSYFYQNTEGINYTPMSKKQKLFVVECKNSGKKDETSDQPNYFDLFCGFGTLIYTNEDAIELIEDHFFNQLAIKNEEHKYKIKISGETNIEKIFIDVMTYTGDVNVKIYPEDLTYSEYFAINKIYISCKVEEYLGKLDEIILTIKANSNTFYTVLVNFGREERIEEDSLISNQLQTGMSYLVTIDTTKLDEFSIANKVVKIMNERSYDEVDIMVNFFSLNCGIFVGRTYNDSEGMINYKELNLFESLSQEVINPEAEGYYNDELQYRITVIENDRSQYKGKLCKIYASAIEVSKEHEENSRDILIPDDTPQQIMFGTKLKHVSYGYIHVDFNNSLLIKFNPKHKAKYLVKIFYENEQTRPDEIIVANDIIEFEQDDWADRCRDTNRVCYIQIDITLDEKYDKYNPVLEFSVKSVHTTPVAYVSKNILKIDYVQNNQPQYYYTELGENEAGFIIANFLRGSGIVYARIVQKDIPEPEQNANWKGKYRLPGDDEIMKVDPYTKELGFYTHELNCENGCYLLIKVISDVQADLVQIDRNYPYSLMVHSYESDRDYKTTPIINIPIDEYIIGSIDVLFPENRIFKFFSVWLNYDAERVAIDFQSDAGSLYINVGKEKPTTEDAHFYIPPSGKDKIHYIEKKKILEHIEDEEKKKKGLRDVILTIGVWTNLTDSIYTTIFAMSVRLENGTNHDIYRVNSDQKALCNPKKMDNSDNYRCVYVIEYDYLNKYTNLFLYASTQDQSAILNIYGRYIDQSDYELGSEEKLKEYIPTKDDNDNEKSYKKVYTDFLYVPEGLAKEQYLLVSVESNKDSTIELLSSFSLFQNGISPNPSTNQLFAVLTNFETSLNFPKDYMVMVNLVGVWGSAELYWNNDPSKKYYLKGRDDRLSITSYKSDNEHRLIVKTLENIRDGSGFVFYLNYNIRVDNSNFDALNLYKSVNYVYTDNDLPLIYYAPISTFDMKPTDYYEIFFTFDDLENEQKKVLTFYENIPFDVTAYIVKESYVYNAKLYPDLAIESEVLINGFYDQAVRTGIIRISGSDISNSKIPEYERPHLYLRVDKADNFKTIRKYKNIGVETTVIKSNSDVSVSESSNQFGSFVENEKQRKYILKVNKLFKYMNLKFSCEEESLTIKIEGSKNQLEKNTTAYGKTYYSLAIDSNDKDTFDLVLNNEKGIKQNYMFQYSFSNDKNNNKYSIPNTKLEGQKIKNKNGEFDYNIKLSPVNDYSKYNLTYIVRLNIGNTPKNADISMKSDSQNVKEYYSPKVTKDKLELSIVNITKNINYIQVIAQIRDKEIIEYLSYDLIEIKEIEKKQETSNDNKNESTTTLVVFIVIGSLLFVVVVVLVIVIIIFNNKNKDLLNQVNTISFAQGRNTDDQNLLLDDGKNGINNSE